MPDGEGPRSGEGYLRDLGLTWEHLADKDILDIGAGQAHFALAAKQHGINVTSVDIAYGGWGVKPTDPIDVAYDVANALEGLPYSDKQFDLLVSHAAMETIVKTRDDFEIIVAEAKRVLRQDGEFRFMPQFAFRDTSKEQKLRLGVLGYKYAVLGREFTEAEMAEYCTLVDKINLDKAKFEHIRQLRAGRNYRELDEFLLADMQKTDPHITMHYIHHRAPGFNTYFILSGSRPCLYLS